MSTTQNSPIADESTIDVESLTIAELGAVLRCDRAAYADAGKVEVPAALDRLQRLAQADDGTDESVDAAAAAAQELKDSGVEVERVAAGESAQDGEPETPRKKDSRYHVFKQTGPTTFELIATDVAARSDTGAIGETIAPDAQGDTFYAVTRWVPRTPKIESKPVRKWA